MIDHSTAVKYTGYNPDNPITYHPAVGLWTLCFKEVQRFLKVAAQTLIAPLITVLLFMVIFSVALGQSVDNIGGVPLLIFLSPGLIMMTVVQNAFANSSSSLIISKLQGNIVDLVMPPLSPIELVAGMTFGAVTRGVTVGALIWAVMWLWIGLVPLYLWFVITFLVLSSALLGLLGVLAGLWAEKFDQMAVITNFIITPLSFLSGTFYSVKRLPETWYIISQFNPFFYMIDGFRYGFTGQSDANHLVGLLVLLSVTVVLAVLCVFLVRRGYKIKA